MSNVSSASPAAAAALAFVRSAAAQRVNLELALETAPRDSRYSPSLVDLMRKEEIALKDNPKLARDLAPRVDDMLSHETRAFFHKAVQQNMKRWQGLQDKLLADIRKLGLDQQPPANATSSASSSDVTSNSSSSQHKVIDLDLEEKRLEADYNLNWAYYEEFHLKEAFKLQAERVDRDWAQHEDELRNDYVSRRAGLLGLSMEAARQQLQAEEAANNASQTGHSSPVRWQHAEKQKTLVHTAPVLSPVRKDSTGSGKGAAARRTGQTQAELDRLEAQYSSAADSLSSQKAQAKRWMARQQARLLAQSAEVAKERAAIASLAATEAQIYMKFVSS